MQHLSDKSRDTLFDIVTECVSNAQKKIELLKYLPSLEVDLLAEVEKILSDLKMGIGQKALDCFTYNKER